MRMKTVIILDEKYAVINEVIFSDEKCTSSAGFSLTHCLHPQSPHRCLHSAGPQVNCTRSIVHSRDAWKPSVSGLCLHVLWHLLDVGLMMHRNFTSSNLLQMHHGLHDVFHDILADGTIRVAQKLLFPSSSCVYWVAFTKTRSPVCNGT